MPRNSGGTYSLPAGNPVISGTTITSTWANSTLNDVATAMTDSLARDGKGAMLAPLEAFDGTSSAPGITWATEQSSGLYRKASHDFAFQVNSNTVMEWLATGVNVTGFVHADASAGATFVVGVRGVGADQGDGVQGQGGTTGGTGVTGFGGAGNGPGGTFTGDSAGAGAVGVGGPTSGPGVVGAGGAPNGRGVLGTGVGTGAGVVGTGGNSSGPGVLATGGTGGAGVVGVGTGVGAGGTFTGGASGAPGISCAGGGSGHAAEIGAGHAHFGGSNPAANVPFTNVQTPVNMCKALFVTTLNNSNVPALNSGFNVDASNPVSANSTTLVLLLGAPMSSSYSVSVEMNDFAGTFLLHARVSLTSTTAIEITLRDNTGVVVDPTSNGVSGLQLYVTATGAQ